MSDKLIKLGISGCLSGNRVRYDGGHKLDRFLTETLGRYVRFVSICPEAGCGLGVPREPMRLTGNPENPRLMTINTGRDLTDQLMSWSNERVVGLEKEDLCGFIFKKNSPACGKDWVKVHTETSGIVNEGKGIFARIFQERFPLLPVEDEERIHDPALREQFVERVFVLKRWRDCLANDRSRGSLVRFHSCHKLMIMARSTEYYRKMGKWVADSKNYSEKELYETYQTLLLEALSLKTTPEKHVNALQHISGYFKKDLTADEKQELTESIRQYRNGHIPIIIPITLLNHYVRKYDQAYLKSQHYLSLDPTEVLLKNHV
jgi:uncharacterized protein YbgA (DUF1722 family)/uncharacterized protein YbbK (DUF523 family)